VLRTSGGRDGSRAVFANDFGRCPCTGIYEKRDVEVRMSVRGEILLLEHVRQGACPLCGSRVYKLEVLERIEATMKAGSEATPR